MAVRRDTVRKQFEDAVQPMLEPGEHLVAGAWCASGPSPLWVQGLFGLVGMVIANVRYYFVWVTDRGSFWSMREERRGPGPGPLSVRSPCRGGEGI